MKVDFTDDRQNYQNGTLESNRGLTIIQKGQIATLEIPNIRFHTIQKIKHYKLNKT
ncbi:hypothetical protein [Clostridium cadaveris]|uniref:hypothetical protein n=1 Tax=Clostridium cadaveris TaxID=1529 RepID=UPI0039A1132D